jgi:hypothetical protein
LFNITTVILGEKARIFSHVKKEPNYIWGWGLNLKTTAYTLPQGGQGNIKAAGLPTGE